MKVVICILVIFGFPLASDSQNKKKDEEARVIYSPAHFEKAESFLGETDANRMKYTEGLMDGFYTMEFFGANTATMDNLKGCTKDMDSKQIAAIFTKYVNDNLETWQLPMSLDAYNALNKLSGGISR
jgi:hypothetical protein